MKRGKSVKKNKNLFCYCIVMFLSAFCLIVSAALFYNMGIYVDKYSTSIDLINGGEFWLYMDWARLFILAFLCGISFIGLVMNIKDRK